MLNNLLGCVTLGEEQKMQLQQILLREKERKISVRVGSSGVDAVHDKLFF